MLFGKILIRRSRSLFRNSILKMSTCPAEQSLLDAARALVPALGEGKHKGEAGRIGIIGGSLEYSGAPYFAGMSALRTGADLVHIFCCKEASIPIKSFSPELIVHPVLDNDNALSQIEPWLDRLNVLLIGPGLGREPKVFETVSRLIEACRILNKPLVIDADGLFLIGQNTNLIKNYPGVVLTPNAMEFTRLVQAFLNVEIKPGPVISQTLLKQLAEAIGSQTIVVSKGSHDNIADGEESTPIISCKVTGSPRRCGGQGDLLAGALSVFLNWSLKSTQPQAKKFACYGACRLVRETSRISFQRKHRGMLASDMLEDIYTSFAQFFEKTVVN